MKLHLSRRLVGFTLIEIMVVIAILAALVGLSAPMLAGKMKMGEVEQCRSNLEQLTLVGIKYGQDMAHARLLPTSGMADDEDTEFVNESEGWWLSIAPEMDTVVLPQKKNDKMKISEIFHCPSDTRAASEDTRSTSTTANMIVASPSTVSYVSWTDATEDPENPNSCIRTSAKQRLDELPWLSDGVPVKGKSVTDVFTFNEMVRPAFERHDGTILVAYAGGTVRAIEVDAEESDEVLFKKFAPELAAKAAGSKKGKGGKKGKKARRRTTVEDED